MADQGIREYRKGNWTVSETMVLIEAKKMDDERRMRRSIGLAIEPTENRNKPAELRWKWIEEYCWRKGCLRSQNQCNDKWDNLMRDYKKVREFERRRRADSSLHTEGSESAATASYWKMERGERKERNLPSNMLPEIYDALVDVVERKTASQGQSQSQRTDIHHDHRQPRLGFVHHQQPAPISSVVLPVLPLPLPPQIAPPPPASFAHPIILPTVETGNSSDSDTSNHHSDSSPAKRRRRSGGGGNSEAAAGPSGSAAPATGAANDISKSAFVIAEAIRASEEGQHKRHRDLVGLQERRLKIEESKAEMNREGMVGLVDAINKLANAILALASSSSSSSSSKKNQNQESGPQ